MIPSPRLILVGAIIAATMLPAASTTLTNAAAIIEPVGKSNVPDNNTPFPHRNLLLSRLDSAASLSTTDDAFNQNLDIMDTTISKDDDEYNHDENTTMTIMDDEKQKDSTTTTNKDYDGNNDVTTPPSSSIIRNKHHESSDWWERVYEGGGGTVENEADVKEEATTNNNNSNDDDNNNSPRPLNRRSHSATVYRHSSNESELQDDAITTATAAADGDDDDDDVTEWMIVSGGFTDEDWNSFPVWAYDLSHGLTEAEAFAVKKGGVVPSSSSSSSSNPHFSSNANRHESSTNKNDIMASNNSNQSDSTEEASSLDDGSDGDKKIRKRRQGPWIDLTGLQLGSTTSAEASAGSSNANSAPLETSSSSSPPSIHGPEGRVGHLSSIHNGCLYVFGGLTYSQGSFHAEYEADGGVLGTMIVWKACNLDALFWEEEEEMEDEEDNNNNAQDNSSNNDADYGGRTENYKKSANGRSLLKWKRIIPSVNFNEPDRPISTINDRNLVEVEGEERNDDRPNPSTHQQRNTIQNQKQRSRKNTLQPPPNPATNLPRGEAQGGNYPKNDRGNNDRDSFVFYGGMHHSHVEDAAANAEFPLGDVWKYEYETETLSLLAPYPPLVWQRDERNGKYPSARTAHAGTIVGDQLIIHGGMDSSNDEYSDGDISSSSSSSSSSYSSPSSSYATYTASPKWRPLADVWVFDLVKLQWKERIQYPQLARSYHSLVGCGDGTVAAFGGYQQDNNIGGETVAFVFKDLIISRSNETRWLKLQAPSDQIPNWRTIQHYTPRLGISNRLEHSAVLDKYGSMYIWGGRFQSVSQISGLWRLDIFTSGDVFTNDANLNLVAATPDGIEAYEAELEALHLFIAVMMFVSLTMSSLFGMMRRQEEERGAQGVSTVTSRRGLSRQVIDSLPLKRYETHRGVTDDGDVVEDVSLSRENSREETALQVEDDAECCPICLVEYEEGCEIRTLPCGHDFDKQCIDMWLDNHTSCPACRQSISNTPLPPQETLSAGNDDGGSNGENNAQDTISYNLQFIPTSLHWLARRAMMNVVDRRDRQWFGPLESHQSDSSMDDAVATDVSNSSQAEEEDDVTTQVEASQGDNSMRPRFLGMRRFFRARGNVRMQVPGDEIAVPSIELV